MNKAEEHKLHAGPKRPSMKRRNENHDYRSERFYLITMAVQGRCPVLGQLVGNAEAPEGSPQAPCISLSPLGLAVAREWNGISTIYPQVAVIAQQVMPDHFHGILYVRSHTNFHLGQVVKGFKLGCNRHLLSLLAAMPSQPTGKDDALLRLAALAPSPDRATLWEQGYNDRILFQYDTLDRWKAYLRDNPRRLAIRRAHPDYFRVRFGILLANQSYAAIGNRFLLSHPDKLQVQLSRRLTEADIERQKAFFLQKARAGTVLVSPAISKGEQAVMRAALDAGLPIIFLSPWGFNSFSKPGHQYFEACARGRLLILAPWEHHNERIPLTRAMCLALNAMAMQICSLPSTP
jgi:hypothetical protein